MIVSYDKDKINSLLRSFYFATGINIQLRNDAFPDQSDDSRISTEYCRMIQGSDMGRCACRASDDKLIAKCAATKQIQMHICHAGLLDIAVPIMNDDEILGYIILGQMRIDSDFDFVEKRCSALPVDCALMKECYMKLPVFDEDRIESITNIATILAEHILMTNMLITKKMSFADTLQRYIEANIDKPLTIKDICENIGISKSALYANIHNYYGCTVSEYINQKRCNKACDLLKNTDYSVEMIAQMTGFSDASYFSKIFKKLIGMPPLKYRKSDI